MAEVSYHLERELANVANFNAIVDYAELYASFIGDFVDLRHARPTPEFLDPNPQKSYEAGNRFADAVRAAGHYGIVYPSLRHPDGTCFAALVPHAVQSVTQGRANSTGLDRQPGPGGIGNRRNDRGLVVCFYQS